MTERETTISEWKGVHYGLIKTPCKKEDGCTMGFGHQSICRRHGIALPIRKMSHRESHRA